MAARLRRSVGTDLYLIGCRRTTHPEIPGRPGATRWIVKSPVFRVGRKSSPSGTTAWPKERGRLHNGDCPQCPARFFVGSTSSARPPGPGVARSWFFPEARRSARAEQPQSARTIGPHPRTVSPGAFAPPVVSTGEAPNKPIALNELPGRDPSRSTSRANALDRPAIRSDTVARLRGPRRRL